jgi:hypothetical protein
LCHAIVMSLSLASEPARGYSHEKSAALEMNDGQRPPIVSRPFNKIV